MQVDAAPIGDRKATVRSSITNGTRLLAGVDGRSTSARRYRDLIADFAADLGGIDALSTAELAQVRQAAALTLRAEQQQAAIVRGDTVDGEDVVRLSNAVSRILAALGVKKRARTVTAPLRERLAAEAAR